MKARSLNYVTQEVASAITGDTRVWRAILQSAGIVSEADFVALVAENAKLPTEVVEHILNCSTKTKKSLVRQGYQVNEGETSYYSVLCGPFARPDSAFTPGVNRIEVVAVPRGGLKTCLKDITPVNMVKPPMPVIQSVMDTDTGVEWILTQGDTVGAAGRNLAPDSSHPGEMAWFANKGGEKVAEGTIVSSDLQLVSVTFAEWPEPGEYEFCLSTRSGLPEEYSLVTVRKAVTVIAPSNGNA